MNNSPSLQEICLLRYAHVLTNKYAFSLLGDLQTKFNPVRNENKLKDKMEIISKFIQMLQLPDELKYKLLNMVQSMAIEVYKWITYHWYKCCFPYNVVYLSLKILCWKTAIRIDKKKTVLLLVKKTELDICERYILSCVYCLRKELINLWLEMSEWHRDVIRDWIKSVKHTISNHLVLARSWTKDIGSGGCFSKEVYYKEDFMKALKSNNEVAISYIWQYLPDKEKIDLLESSDIIYNMLLNNKKPSACPYLFDENFAEVLYFVLSQMNERQLQNCLESEVKSHSDNDSDCNDDDCGDVNRQSNKYSLVFSCLLEWPQQNYFLETVNQMWNFLPLKCYTNLIKKFVDTIANRKLDYDYYSLLKEFWSLSPENYKRDFLIQSSFQSFQQMFNIQNFESTDAEVIIFMLKNATVREKESINFDIFGKDLCCRLIKEFKWELVEVLSKNCISSEERMRKFKQDLVISINEGHWFNNFISQKRSEELATFINWCLLSEDLSSKENKDLERDLYNYRLEVIKKFFCWCLLHTEVTDSNKEYNSKNSTFINKFEVIESLVTWCFTSKQELNKLKGKLADDVKKSYKSEIFQNILKHGLEVIQNFITWCCSSKEESDQFKKSLIYSMKDENKFEDLIYDNKIELIENFIIWCFSSEEDICLFKKDLLYSMKDNFYINNIFFKLKGNDGKRLYWLSLSSENIVDTIKEDEIQQMDKFVKWCLSNSDEISKFKTAILNSVLDDHDIYNLIYGNNVKMVDRFITWCSASCDHSKIKRRLLDIIKKSNDFQVLIYKNKFTQISKFLRWGLSKTEVIKFKVDLIYFFRKKSNFKTLIYKNGFNWIRKLTYWCLPSDKKRYKFTTALIRSMKDDYRFKKMIFKGKVDVVEKFITWSLLGHEAISQFKEHLFSIIKDDDRFKNLVRLQKWHVIKMIFHCLLPSKKFVKTSFL